MDNFTWLLFLCISMFLGAFGSGYIPLTFSMDANKLRLVTIFGAGLIVGTALIVIIPEGIAMHYKVQLSGLSGGHSPESAPEMNIRRLDDLLPAAPTGDLEVKDVHDHSTHSHNPIEEKNWYIGASLAVGFAFQLIVDRFSGDMHGHSHNAAVPSSESDADLELNVRANAGGDHSAKSRSAVVGMIVHAFVDGIALGAAIAEGTSSLGLIVFFAIMLHKAPSSFGLSSYLLHHGISHAGVKKRLFLFSLSAPSGAIFTYLFLTLKLFEFEEEMLALSLLFSGGTFLYVATAHILPEIQGAHSDIVDKEDDATYHGHSHTVHTSTNTRMTWGEVGIMVIGVLLPLLLNMGHSH